jgi:hypothetical protein
MGSVLRDDGTAKTVVHPNGSDVHVLTLRVAAMADAENTTLGLPMNRWSYSTAADQFGAKPISIPVPTAPPQRVSLA